MQGRECIYKEKGLIQLVRVRRVTVSEWGVNVECEPLPAAGLEPIASRDLRASAAWEIFSVSSKYVYAAHVGWMLVFREDLIEKIKDAAAAAKDHVTFVLQVQEIIFRGESDS